MLRIINFINKLSNLQKIICLILILGFALLISIGIPTIARYKNRSTIITTSVWDGTVASSYKAGSGSAENPYIISNGSELAYFYTQLLHSDYESSHFVLKNDIVLNEGIFNYDSVEGIQYIIDSQLYYVDYYTNKYYDNVNMEGTEVGTINTFYSLDGFKGSFDGGSFRIQGLYITDEDSDEVALFTNLEGNINDLYVENAMIYGGSYTAGIASTANNATLSNILFDGYVVGKNTELTKNINTIPTSPIINLQNIELTENIDLTNNIPFIGSEIVSTSITGNYEINGPIGAENMVKINDVIVSNGSFDIDLGNSIMENIPVLTSTDSEEEVTLTFSNLSYNIVYKYAVSGGIVAMCNNTIFENTINKASVYGYSTSGGLVGVTTNSINISQSYNVGDINSEYVSGGLVGTIEKSSNNIFISKSYNSGDMIAPDIGGLIGILNNNSGSVSINNVFNTSTTNYSIGTIFNTTVNVTDAYYVNGVSSVNEGIINGTFVSVSMEDLETKSFLINNLVFNEFVNFGDLEVNNQNVWVYELDSLPILFIDDLNNPIASIHASVYSWNNLSSELSTVKLASNITFSIEASDDLSPLKEKYYYISNSVVALTPEEISQIDSWNIYSGITQISVEGFYVIYAKVVDFDDNVTYMNTDLLILDLSGSSVSVNIDDSMWSNLRSELGYVYTDRPKNVTVEATDDLSGVASINYYVTNEVLSTNGLNELSESSWTPYSNEIPVDEIGEHIIYVQVIDYCNHVTYANTDYIVFNGYTVNHLNIGRNAYSYLNADAYVTNKSTISLNISYLNSDSINLNNHTHNLISSILLPMGSKITLIDHIIDKVYEYQVTTDIDIFNYNDSCDVLDLDCIKVATYPFTLFKEVGTGAISKLFTESAYYHEGVVNEDFTIVLDLFNTDTEINYNDVVLFMELHDSEDNNVRPTLYSTMEKFNIYSNVDDVDVNASLYLTTDYNGNDILFNSDSSTNISITSGLNYKYVNDNRIIDTTYEDKEIGLSVKLVDSEGDIVDRDALRNIIFKVDDINYYPGDDSTVRINLESGIAEVTKNLTIITSENNGNLDGGSYYFKISNYVSYDGYYYDELGDTELSIPVNVSDNYANIIYSFDVIMDDTNRIISKASEEITVLFNILQNGSLINPNIRISLYKKDQLTAYNQDYSIVDLSDYVNDDLHEYANNVYYVATDPVQYTELEPLYNIFELDLITANFENTGYKFVFDLYDGTKKIGTIDKYFIVK